MRFSCGNDFESLIPVVDESRERYKRGEGMDVCQNGVYCNKELWPIEHPVEPPDEDQPVKCPMPHTSLVNERFSDSMRKRTDISAVMNEEGMMVAAAEPPAQAVRKRHHTSTHEDHHTLTPLLRMPPLLY